ncbi:thyroglobulin-like [Argopecten irradians]|uniref:thyroglobulin-like n=1 Tax=Argopecten irradians TaxID=31199 RepID=UPI0037131C88
METATLALLLVIGITMAAGSPTPCRDQLTADQAYLAVITAQHGGIPPSGYNLPDCEPDGTYSPMQCKGASCHCKSAEGIQITDNFEIGQTDKSSCRCARDEYEFTQTKMLGQTFDCTATGGYTPVQCTGSVCFCVDFKGDRAGPGSVNIAFVSQLGCEQF